MRNSNSIKEIGLILKELRIDAGWSSRHTALIAGIKQSTVSRIENGRRVNSATPLEKIVEALPIDPSVAQGLRHQINGAYSGCDNRRVDTGVSLVRDVARRWERVAAVVKEFQAAMIPRALRSPEYANAANNFPSPLVDRLGDSRCVFEFVITEGALRTWPADGAVMPAQLDRVARACELPNVRLGVVPWSVRLPVMPPHGFTVFDDEAVTVETFTAQMTITEPDAVAAYVDAYARLEAVAVTGDEAAEMLGRIRRDYEKLTH
ncbi:transcriptional regulator with XRE-family HTH domain [Lipingzhangella halophila]|uniref:Transcriptional regulator with XRE-family HTH domain n=1 Tax=Lipingzhangella halophila TaxID=1783352 RepID=A0A7W7RP53_9ACTN|nr:Scr1 family TA system antitoxin-like transcriptional regulator [Lipingzhangella halophila]MBB4935604.1 transcriptional regulator with XRE-family HTH domain [Lipingzhangella halophila]